VKKEEEENHDFLECGSCRKYYDDEIIKPVTFLCGHTYCSNCILQFGGAPPKNLCPTCRQPFDPSAGLKMNITLKNAIDSFRHTQKEL